MWDDNEWYDWLTDNGGEEMTRKYHPESFDVAGTLDEFFG
jgi:hypothetical protein